MTDPQLELCFSADEIAKRVIALSLDIAAWCKTAPQPESLVISPVMNGAIFFFADLARAVPVSMRLMPLHAKAYQPTTDKLREEGLEIDLNEFDYFEKRVLVVDDICDSGATLAALTSELTKAGAKEVRTAVLIRRKVRTPQFTPDWTGFEYEGDAWFVGYGMDSGGMLRNLPDIYTVKK